MLLIEHLELSGQCYKTKAVVLAAPDKYQIQGLMFVTKNYGWKCFTGHLKDMQRNFGNQS